MDCECHEHKAWYHERTELDPGNTKVEFKKDPKKNNPEAWFDYAMDRVPGVTYAQS